VTLSGPARMKTALSVVVPFYNEAGCAGEVIAEIRKAQPEAEIVAVDDGSTDGTGDLLRNLSGVRVVTLGKNCGQSAALYAGLRAARGDVLAMMDGDGQNDPADLAKLVAALENADVAYGVRAKRKDSAARIVAGKVANAIRRAALGDAATDTGCTLKVIRREHVDLLVPFNGLHRYLPAFFARSGLRAVEIPVNHRPRRAGVSKYTLGGRALRGVYDLVGVRWLLSRRVAWPAHQVP
jgi:dolichol-phosphate mannosyltransferase